MSSSTPKRPTYRPPRGKPLSREGALAIIDMTPENIKASIRAVEATATPQLRAMLRATRRDDVSTSQE